jgi:large subunit ribosomal protein L9
MTVTLKANAGEEGKLFGSVGTADISHALNEAGVAVEKHEVRLPMGAYRQTGEYDVLLHLHTDVNVTVKLVIEAE